MFPVSDFKMRQNYLWLRVKGSWPASVIKVVRATYGVQISHEYSAGESKDGIIYGESKLIGHVDKVGSRVTKYYTKSKVAEYDGVKTWLTAT